MAALFQLKCDLENDGAEFDEGASEEALRKLLKEHRETIGQKERSSLSPDVSPMLNHGYASTHEAVFSKFQALLKELEGKRFEDEARCLDVFVLGREHGSQLEMVGNLPYAETLYSGALRAARTPAGKKALARVYGKRCNEGILLQYLGLLSKKQRRFKKAEEYYLEALEVPGVTLALMDTVLHQLHSLYMNTGDIVKVKNTHKRWKKLLVKHKAPDNGYIYSAYHEKTADLARMKGRYVEAIEHLQKTLEIFETTYGKDSWLLVAKLSNLAQLYLDAKDYDKAYDCLQRGYSIASKVREPNYAESTSGNPTAAFLSHPAYRTVKQQHLQSHMLAFMGRIHYHQGRDREALPNFERAFTMTYDPQNPDMAVYMNDYGRTLMRLGRASQACTVCQSASKLQARVFGPMHLQTLVAKCTYGHALMKADRLDEAKSLLDVIRVQALTTLGAHHPVTQEIDTAIECVAVAKKSSRSNVFSGIGLQKPGDVVRPDFNITCGACAKTEAEGTKFKVCSKCKRVKYCSADCQKNDWKAHKKICRPLPV